MKWFLIFCSFLPALAQSPTVSILSPGSDFAYPKGLPITLLALSDQAEATLTWTFSDGTTASGSVVEYTANTEGELTVSVVATDSAGNTSRPDDRILYIYDFLVLSNSPTVQSVTPAYDPVNPDMGFTLSAVVSDPDNDGPFTYKWFWLENDRPVRIEGENPRISLPLNDGGYYSISLMVFDAAGHPSQVPGFTSVRVLEGNLPPTIHHPRSGYSLETLVGELVVFSAEASDPEGDLPISYTWTMPDESLAQGQNVTWLFQEAGDYTVQLSVSDSLGHLNYTAFPVAVIENAEPPFAAITQPALTAKLAPGEELILQGSSETAIENPRWILTDLLSGEVTTLAQGLSPGRVVMNQTGMFQLRLLVDKLGATSEENSATVRFVNVVERSRNRAPSAMPTGGYTHVVGNGETLSLNVEPLDPEGEEVTVLWAVDGVVAATKGSAFQHVFNLPSDAFYQGLSVHAVDVLAVDPQGEAPDDLLRLSVYVYQNQAPPEVSFEGFAPGEILYSPVGEPVSFSPILEHGEGLDLDFTWRGIFLGELLPFFESDGSGPQQFTPKRSGLISLSLSVVTQDGALAGLPASILVQAYDPNALPVVALSQPRDGLLRTEPNQVFVLEGEVFDPNYQEPLFGIDYFQTISNTLTWTITGENYETTLTGGRRELSLDQPGTYLAQLSATNNLGLTSQELTVQITVVETLDDAAYEPNDSREQATPLSGGAFTGFSLSADDPIDWFVIPVTSAEGLLKMSLTLAEGEEAIDAEVFFEERAVGRSSLQPGRVNTIIFNAVEAGQYYLKLTQAGSSNKRGPSFSIGIGVVLPRMNFPYVGSTATSSTLLTVVNPTGEEAFVSLTAFNAFGELLGEASFCLPGNGHREHQTNELFGDSAQIKWVSLASDHAVVGLTTVLASDGETAVAERAEIGGLPELVVPHIAQDVANWYTWAAVANESADAVNTVFETKAGTQTVPGIAFSGEADLIDFEKFFGNSIPSDAGWGRFIETGGGTALSGMELFGTRTGSPRLAALSLSANTFLNPNFVASNRDLYFPHVAADSKSFWTGMAFVNTEQVPSDIRLWAYDDQGAVLASEIATIEGLGKRVGLVHSLFESLDAQAPISWVRLETSGAFSGYVLFGDNTGDNNRLAGLPAVRHPGTEAHFQKLMSDPTTHWTGLAVVNLSDSRDAELIYEAFDGEGKLLGTSTKSVGPLRKDVVSLHAVFEGGLPTGTCWLKLRASQPVAAFELFGDLTNKFMAGAVAL